MLPARTSCGERVDRQVFTNDRERKLSPHLQRNASDSNTTPKGDLLSGQSRDPARFTFLV